jgi:hypothetical protein
VLIKRAVKVGPAAGNLHVGLVNEPAVPGRVPARSGGVNELWREGLHPPVHRDVVDVDTALGQQLLDVPIGEPVAQVPAHRNRDDLSREPAPVGADERDLELII